MDKLVGINGVSKQKSPVVQSGTRGGFFRTLLLWFLAISLLPLTIVSLINYQGAYEALNNEAKTGLMIAAESKANQVQRFFKESLTTLLIEARRKIIMSMAEDFRLSFEAMGLDLAEFVKSPEWALIAEQYGGNTKFFITSYGYHDFFLIDFEGNVLYTDSREQDLGTNLFTGKYANTLFGKSCRKAFEDEQPVFSDFERYDPSGDVPACFLITLIYDENGEKIGLVAVQVDNAMIDRILMARSGLGQEGEAYLVGSDLRVRSNFRLDDELAILGSPVETEQTLLWRKQYIESVSPPIEEREEAFVYIGRKGVKVLGLHQNVEFAGVRMAVITEIPESEALAVATTQKNIALISVIVTTMFVFILAFIVARRITGPVKKLSEWAKQVAAGDLSIVEIASPANEIGVLNKSFRKAVTSLRQVKSERERNSWLSTGQSELEDKIRGDRSIEILCRNIMTFIANYLNVQVGTLYVNEGEGTFRLMASYAYKTRKNLSNEFKMGEGLIGQAALEKQSIILTRVPDDYITVTSSLGKKKPKNILVIPLIYNETVMGILELGSFDEFSELKTTFLEGISERVAIAINSSRARLELQSALEVTRKQAEELKAANEELEEQTQRLQASEEELKAQQEELQVTNEELEEKTESLERQKQDIEQKNMELDQTGRELEERAEELARASKYKSEFLANMSHELRTPLNSILLLSSLLTDNKEDNLSEEQLEFANVIHGSGDELLSLIDEILDLSKIEAGQMELRMKEVLIRDLADSVKANFQHMADDKGLNLKIEVSETAPGDIFTDRKRVEQIIKNFMSNAIKFTEKGSVTVNFGPPPRDVNLLRSGLDIENAIAIAVRDTGIGIPPEKQKVVFEAFQQVESGTTRQYRGTGLGLSISRELAQLLGGEIQLNSEEGQGSTFTIYLPIAKDDVKREEKKAHDQPAIPQGRMPLRAGVPVSKSEIPRIPDDRDSLKEEDKTILVIEDDPRFAKLLLKQCHQNGFKCLASATGEEGLKLAETYLPKAVILDIRLPGIDGWAVLNSLKDKPETRHIPVHIISVEDATTDALKKGAIGFLEKPVKKEELEGVFGKVRDMLSREIKDLLVVEDNENQRKGIVKLVGNGDVHIDEAATGEETIRALKSKKYDCVILDLGLPDMTGFQLLKRLEAMEAVAIPPVIVYTGRELTREEEAELSEYAESIIIKGVGSEDRLLDESSLFLHRVVGKMPKKKQKIITDLHDSDVMFRDRQVLIVDDDMRNLFALSRALEEKGLKVLKAEDGQKAIEVMKKEPGVDLILMDIMMPVMDGYETMKRIRAQEKFRNLPIIALTAKAMKQDRARCIEAGASDYLPKPVDVKRLFSMMRVWLYR